MDPIGYQINRTRRARNMTQSELSCRAGLPQSNLSNIEKGKKDLTVMTLVRIARALGVSPGGFFQEEKRRKKILTRQYAESLAQAVWQTGHSQPGENRVIIRSLRTLLPGGLKRPLGRARVERAWFELPRRFTPVEIKLLIERVRDEGRRRRPKA